MFVLGIRTSTWLTALVFIVVALIRHDRKALLAGWAWLAGFEAAFQITSLAMGLPLPGYRWGPFLLIALGISGTAYAARCGVRPNLWLLGIAACVWVAWVATGFHVNRHTMVGFDPTAEALNEGAKTLWALAYLVPFWSRSWWRGLWFLAASGQQNDQLV